MGPGDVNGLGFTNGGATSGREGRPGPRVCAAARPSLMSSLVSSPRQCWGSRPERAVSPLAQLWDNSNNAATRERAVIRAQQRSRLTTPYEAGPIMSPYLTFKEIKAQRG